MIKFSKNVGLASVFAVSLIVSLSGCLRYTPSRSEIEDENPEADKMVRSAEEFYKSENAQREELLKLIAERSQPTGEKVSYSIGVGDLVQISVFDVAELNRQVRVRPGGMISLPLVDNIMAAGKTESELQDELSKKLDAFLQHPQVTVFIAEYAAHRVSVLGEVARPGVFPLKRDDYTLLEILSEAGGRTLKAGGYVVFLPGKKQSENIGALEVPLDINNPKKVIETKNFGIEIPFDEISGSTNREPVNIPLLPGDTIIVPESGMVQVDGEVNKPGSYNLASRMTLLGAVASAGSITYSADVKSIEVIREISPGKKAVLTVNLEQIALGGGKDMRLRDGDVVRVPSAGGRFVTRQVVTAITSVVNFGVGSQFNVNQ